MKLVFDIETDHISVMKVTKVWCVVTKDIETGDIRSFTDVTEAINYLKKASLLIAHNGIMYDLPVLQRLAGFKFEDWPKTIDTLILSRLFYNNIRDRHSLDSWGETLGNYKIKYTDFSGFSQEMLDYCIQDVEVTNDLFNYIRNDWDLKSFSRAINIEMQFARVISQQVLNGFPFDLEKALQLVQQFDTEIKELSDQLLQIMPQVKDMTAFRAAKKDGRVISETEKGYWYLTPSKKDERFKEWKYDEPNPYSRLQIVEMFLAKGWEPKEKTEKGTPIVDETILESLPYPEAKLFARLFRLNKQRSMIKSEETNGNGWISYLCGDRIHGNVNTNAAITGRATHCVPMDSKALTRTGWKYYHELKIGDEILGYDFNRNIKLWTKITDLNKFENTQIGEIGNESVTFRCTLEHKWVVRQRNSGKDYYRVVAAAGLKHYDSIVINAPMYNTNSDSNYRVPTLKYEYDHMTEMLRMSNSELNSFLSGFLLADGCLLKSRNGTTRSWSFSQSEGDICDLMHTAMYIYSDKRISKIQKQKVLKSTHRPGYNVTQTQVGHLRSHDGMLWRPTTIEDSWCPTTETGFWVMKQGDFITITGNSSPNVSQVDRKNIEMRKCWKARDGWALVSVDADALEFRLLASELAKYDGGSLTETIENGKKEEGTDIHSRNQRAVGLNKRDSAKVFIYAMIYGAGDKKLGLTYAEDQGLKNPTPQKLMYIGREARAKLMDAMTGMKELILEDFMGLDGRPLWPRSEHAKLNTRIQSAGAVVMKMGLINFYILANKSGYVHMIDWGLTANVHDEIVFEVRPEIAEIMRDLCVRAIEMTTEQFNLGCPIRAQGQIGKNWGEIH